MKFKIDNKIFEAFSTLILGVITAKNISNQGVSQEVASLLRQEEKAIQEKYDSELISSQEKIEVWRRAYSLFGAKPKENKSSVENLYKMVLKGIALKHINKLVDVYNSISLKHMLPVGGEDLDVIKGDILLTFAQENEPAVLLLGDKEARAPHIGEVIYKDAVSAICRRWNWREADRTKITEETQNCILVMEGLSPVTKEDIMCATKELQILTAKECGGVLSCTLLDKNMGEVDL